MSRTWISFVMIALVALLAAGCGRKVTPTQVALATQPPPATTPLPPPSASAAREAPSTASSAVATSLTEDGHQFWGAPDAPVTMIDFSDFM